MFQNREQFLQYVAWVLLLVSGGRAYKAAVLEYHPSTEDTASKTLLKNLQNYKNYAQIAKNQNADIIVFPEYGLTSLSIYNIAELAINLSDRQQSILTELSTIARNNEIYVVVNLLEKATGEQGKTKYYNTNLVYNRRGQIIAKYRKMNLYKEKSLTPGNEVVTFSTDFGVTFGIFTCFDITSYSPSRAILNSTVTDVVYPTAWISTLPFYFALSIQHGYAAANGVNLLAANYNSPQRAFGGSGIFLADGTAETYVSTSPNSKLLVKEVKQRHGTVCSLMKSHRLREGRNLNGYSTETDFISSDFESEKIDLSQGVVSRQVCQKQFCCSFNITIKQPGSTLEIYKLVAFDGFVSIEPNLQTHVRVCALVICRSDAVESCGARINGTTRFTSVSVGGTFDKNSGDFYTPTSLRYDLELVDETKYCETAAGGKSTHVEFSTVKEQHGVLVFGIVGKASA